eukprot:PhM_4_TR14135/c0_g1_i1/m.39332
MGEDVETHVRFGWRRDGADETAVVVVGAEIRGRGGSLVVADRRIVDISTEAESCRSNVPNGSTLLRDKSKSGKSCRGLCRGTCPAVAEVSRISARARSSLSTIPHFLEHNAADVGVVLVQPRFGQERDTGAPAPTP